jgi:EAL domain-containing protein (putative c-di-GMP-specific phosphodiesterase class I)/GGDEF domain-containing protein
MTSRLHMSSLPSMLRHAAEKKGVTADNLRGEQGKTACETGTTPAAPAIAMSLDTAVERLRLSAPSIQDADTGRWLTRDNLRTFLELYEQRRLHAVFQPIIDFQSHRFLGYEGLIRGPVDSALHTPKLLLGLAQECGLTVEFERLCREIVLRDFAQAGLAGRLFLNVSVGCLADPRFIDGETTRLLQTLRMRPDQIVIEITENQEVADFAALHEVLTHYRAQGYQIAIDDLGEGFSNLRMWSEVRPEFVKIDQHFIRGIADDPLKFRLVQAMRDIAESSHAALIAEGIETESEFATLRDLGIAYGQGYLIARPVPLPDATPTPEVKALLNQCGVIVFPHRCGPSSTTVRQLLQPVAPLRPHMLNQEVFERFERQPEQIVLPVINDDGTPLGLINRHSLVDRFSRPFRRELYGKRPCTQFMNADPIRVDHSMPVHELGQLLGRAEHRHLVDGFVITENGRYLGIGSSQSLMGLITEMQIRAARYANPLTQLPGNVPINEHIDRLLANDVACVASYCDLDHFKPYNDCYGYRKGDQIIQTLAAILIRHCDPRLDFIGHVGGDDFILLLQSPDWETRCRAMLDDFDDELPGFVAEEHLMQGGYFAEDRRGTHIFHALPALSIGALPIEPSLFQSHHEVSSAVSNAKKEAKKIPGSSLFIERRRPPV